jgi:hypothetical protein
MRPLLAIAALFFVLAASAHASGTNAGTETTASGPLSATLAWDAGEDGPANMRLTITRAGAVAFARPIPRVCGTECDRFPGDTDEFQFIDLDGKGEPELILDSFNFERCCETLGIYEADPATGGYSEFVLDSPTSMFLEDADDDGRSEIVTRDGRFADALDSSYGPRRVFHYEAGAVHDVTRDFPDVVSEDLDVLVDSIDDLKRNDFSARGMLAAYVADKYLLGKGKSALKELDAELARGVVGGPKRSRAYRRQLLSLLHRYGYR